MNTLYIKKLQFSFFITQTFEDDYKRIHLPLLIILI